MHWTDVDIILASNASWVCNYVFGDTEDPNGCTECGVYYFPIVSASHRHSLFIKNDI